MESYSEWFSPSKTVIIPQLRFTLLANGCWNWKRGIRKPGKQASKPANQPGKPGKGDDGKKYKRPNMRHYHKKKEEERESRLKVMGTLRQKSWQAKLELRTRQKREEASLNWMSELIFRRGVPPLFAAINNIRYCRGEQQHAFKCQRKKVHCTHARTHARRTCKICNSIWRRQKRHLALMLMPRAVCIEKNNCVIKEGFYLVRLEMEQLQTRKFSFVVLNRGEIKLKVAEFAIFFCWP